MKKVYGNKNEFALVKEEGTRITIGYDLQELLGSDNAIWYEIYFYTKKGKPSFEQAKQAIIDGVNSKTDEKILSGFVWNGINVWLSAENQRNFSEAQRMAKDYGEAVLPLRFKLGEDTEGNPVYHTFNTIEELNGFYIQAFAYVNQCLNDGWAEKDSIDWSIYKPYFPDPETPVAE